MSRRPGRVLIRAVLWGIVAAAVAGGGLTVSATAGMSPLVSVPSLPVPAPSLPPPSLPLPTLPLPSQLVPSLPASPLPSVLPSIGSSVLPTALPSLPLLSTAAPSPRQAGSSATPRATASVRTFATPGSSVAGGSDAPSASGGQGGARPASPAGTDTPTPDPDPAAELVGGGAASVPGDFSGVLVPALAIGVPALLVLAVLTAQLLGGAAALPAVRRTLGGIGLRLPGRWTGSAAAAAPQSPPAAKMAGAASGWRFPGGTAPRRAPRRATRAR